MSYVMLAYQQIPKHSEIRWPVFGSPKLDGIRAHTCDPVVMSRNNKRIPNEHIQDTMGVISGTGLDGELMSVNGCNTDFNSVQSAIMSEHGSPVFTFNVFDAIPRTCADEKTKFVDRYKAYSERVFNLQSKFKLPWLRVVQQRLLQNGDELDAYMADCLEQGYEGVMLRSPSGLYKYGGRSTLKQQYLLKYKYFHEDEATIIGAYELMHNMDTSTKKLENMLGGNTLGGFHVMWKGKEFDIGGGKGMTAELRRELWAKRHELVGRSITFKYQELSSYGIPRFPTYKVIRDPRV